MVAFVTLCGTVCLAICQHRESSRNNKTDRSFHWKLRSVFLRAVSI